MCTSCSSSSADRCQSHFYRNTIILCNLKVDSHPSTSGFWGACRGLQQRKTCRFIGSYFVYLYLLYPSIHLLKLLNPFQGQEAVLTLYAGNIFIFSDLEMFENDVKTWDCVKEELPGVLFPEMDCLSCCTGSCRLSFTILQHLHEDMFVTMIYFLQIICEISQSL